MRINPQENMKAGLPAKPAPIKIMPVNSPKFPSIKVGGDGNVKSSGGRPTISRGTSDGMMVRGKKF